MLKDNIIKELNLQFNRELQSFYKYLGMAAYCGNNDLPGCAQWLKIQAKEERMHAEKIYQYLEDLDAEVELQALEKPKQEFNDLQEVFQAALQAEEDITTHLVNLANLADAEKDQLTWNFLQWFMTEQVEEIASAKAVLVDIEKLGISGIGLFMLDEKLGSRSPEE